MNFLDSQDVSRIAPIVLQVLQLPDNPKETIGAYRQKLLTCVCRELEKLIRSSKSTRAQANATACALGNLSNYPWAARGRLAGKHAEGFHFEHTIPASEMVRKLLALSNPTASRIEEVLSTAKVTWVTKDENELLNSLGFRSRRENWQDAYAAAKITLVEE